MGLLAHTRYCRISLIENRTSLDRRFIKIKHFPAGCETFVHTVYER